MNNTEICLHRLQRRCCNVAGCVPRNQRRYRMFMATDPGPMLVFMMMLDGAGVGAHGAWTRHSLVKPKTKANRNDASLVLRRDRRGQACVHERCLYCADFQIVFLTTLRINLRQPCVLMCPFAEPLRAQLRTVSTNLRHATIKRAIDSGGAKREGHTWGA